MERPLYFGVLAVVAWYVIFETGRVLFAYHALAFRIMDWWPLLFMLGIAVRFRSWWVGLYVVGSLLNWLVMAANGGRMPVYGEPVSERLVRVSEATRLPWLSDWFIFWGKECSPGDVLILLGWWGALYVLMRAIGSAE